MKPLYVKSSAFQHEKPLPLRFAGDGDGLSPPLAWGDPPVETLSYALTVTDPEAQPTEWTHWIAWNIAPFERELPEGAGTASRPDQAANDYGHLGYGGPCPPKGHGPHRYVFTLYALDTTLVLPRSTSLDQFRRAIHGHVVAQGDIVGTYCRG